MLSRVCSGFRTYDGFVFIYSAARFGGLYTERHRTNTFGGGSHSGSPGDRQGSRDLRVLRVLRGKNITRWWRMLNPNGRLTTVDERFVCGWVG